MRSSIRVWSVSRPAFAASWAAIARGAERDPGLRTRWRTPPRTSSSTTVRARAVAALGLVVGITRRSSPTSALTAASRASQRAVTSGGAASASSRAGSTSGRVTGSQPSTGSSGSVVTSSVSSETVPSPQAYGSDGSAAARATPAAMPTLVSRALLTTTGSPISSAIRRQARTPPSGCTLSTATSAASRSRTRYGSAARRIDSSAAMGTVTRRRRAARSSTEAQGCSAYSSPPAARSRSGTACAAVATSHAPLASTRIAPVGPRASRTASTPGLVVGQRLAGLGDLDLGGAAAGGRDQPVGGGGVHGGHGGVDRHPVAQRRGPVAGGGLAGREQPRRRGLVVVLREGAELAPAGRAAQQHRLAVGDAAEPLAHRHPDHSDHRGPAHGPSARRATSSASASPVHLVVVGAWELLEHQQRAGRPEPGLHQLPQVLQPGSDAAGRDHHGRDQLTPLGVGDPHHGGLAHPRVGEQLPLDRTAGDVDPAADDHLVTTPQQLQAPVVVEAAQVGGVQPPVPHHLLGGGHVEPTVPVVVPLEQRGPAQQHLTLAGDLQRDPVERVAVVDAAASGLGQAVGGDHAHPPLLGGPAVLGAQPAAADEDGVEPGQRGDAGGVGRLQQAHQLGGHDRGVATGPGHRLDGAAPALRTGVVEDREGFPRAHGAEEDLEPGDVTDGQRQQPLAVAAEVAVRGLDRRAQRGAGEPHQLGGAGRPAGRHHERRRVVLQVPGGQGVEQGPGVTGDGVQLRHGVNLANDPRSGRIGRRGPRSRLHHSCVRLGRRSASAHPAGGRRAGPGGHRGGRPRGVRGLVEGRAGPAGGAGAAGGRQLRQRLLRRGARHRRRPGGTDAPGGLGRGVARRGPHGGLPRLRRRRGRGPGAGRHHRLVAGPGRPGVHRRGLALHRRAPALRLRGPGRGDGLRVLRPGRGARDDVRPDRGLAGRGLVRRHRDRRAGLRHPRGQQPARHPDRPRGRQAHAGGAARRGPHPRPVRAAASLRRGSHCSGSR